MKTKLARGTLAALAGIVFWASAVIAAGKPMVTGIENKSDASTIKLVVAISAKFDFKDFTLDDPARLVVDFPGADTNLVSFKEEYADPVLQAARLGRPNPETLRLVVDLKYLTPYKIEKAPNGRSLAISIPRKVESRSNTVNVLPGITYTAKMDMADAGPMAIHILDINLNNPGSSLRIGIGEDRLGGLETLSSMVKRTGAAIGINGGYFNMSSGLPIDLLVIKGKVLLLPDRYRGFFGIDKNGAPVFMRPNSEISVKLNDETLRYVNRLNFPPKEKELAIFTPEFGKTTGTPKDRIEAVIIKDRIVEIRNGGTVIPQDGIVLSGDKSHSQFFGALKKGDKAVAMISSYPDLKNVAYGISAGPMLVKDGELQDKLVEDFTVSSGIIAKTNPRTAAGRTNNNHLVFAVVEGRNTRSTGMTLEQLAALMKSLGCVDAINLDGGGSSEIVIGSKIMNQLPGTGERPLANAILLFRK